MKVLMRSLWLALAAAAVSLPAMAQPAASQSEFVPISQIPAAEQLPAAPFVMTAYAFVWVAVLFYVFTLWRRLGKVDADMQALARRSAGGGSR